MTTNLNQVKPGWDVYSNEGDHIGSVDDVTTSYFVVRKGLLMPKDYYIPQDGVMKVDAGQGRVFLNCGKNDLDARGWDQPIDDASTAGSRDYVATGSTGTNTTRDTEFAQDQGTQRIPRYEEELRAEKQTRDAGEVRVNKDVTEEQQEFDVPVTREDVEVRRVAVNRPASGSEEAFQEGDTIRVPVRSEEVQVSKEPRVVEEIEIRKGAHEETQRVGDTVRREQVNVDRSGDVNVRERDLVGAGADRMQKTDLGDQGYPQGSHPTDVDALDEDSDRTDDSTNTRW